MCLKSYILRKTCGFAQIAQKNSAKPRKTHCVLCAKIAQKFEKKICAKIAQILCKRFSHFVETLGQLETKLWYSLKDYEGRNCLCSNFRWTVCPLEPGS